MMKRGSAMAAVGGLFLVGVLAGGLAVHLYHGTATPPPGPPPGPVGPGWRMPPERFLQRLADELELTGEQRTEIERILREDREALDALRRELRPRVEAQLDRTRERIREVLSPEQAERFEHLQPLRPRRGPRHGRGRAGPSGGDDELP